MTRKPAIRVHCATKKHFLWPSPARKPPAWASIKDFPVAISHQKWQRRR